MCLHIIIGTIHDPLHLKRKILDNIESRINTIKDTMIDLFIHSHLLLKRVLEKKHTKQTRSSQTDKDNTIEGSIQKTRVIVITLMNMIKIVRKKVGAKIIHMIITRVRKIILNIEKIVINMRENLHIYALEKMMKLFKKKDMVEKIVALNHATTKNPPIKKANQILIEKNTVKKITSKIKDHLKIMKIIL